MDTSWWRGLPHWRQFTASNETESEAGLCKTGESMYRSGDCCVF